MFFVRKLRYYLAWRVVFQYLPNLIKSVSFKEKISCIEDTIDVMGFAVSAMFLRQAPNYNESKQLIESMLTSIKKSFKKNLDNLDWLDDVTRQAAREKADAVVDIIGIIK